MVNKSKLSAVMLALIAAGASAPVMMAQFQHEKEGTSLTAYQDKSRGIWTICGGVTYVNGKPVIKGMKLTREQCDKIDKAEQAKALAWVDKNVHVPLSEPQKVGIASFCPWNIGPGKCFSSTFYRKLNAGDRFGACAEIKRWVHDAGRDCRIRENNCYGQVIRRDQESELTCWGLDK
ncbi:TPA: lysozyme [Citrobacter freundii]|uniref:Lysozyme n=2 Tax=Enterobacteriaceae TaxID=543 RepID=A0A9P4DFJ2_CITFR|nr:lysozyme [Salmonella enterica]ECE0587437.1 lysozyme [Salmonella enterica subsp. enterica]ECO0747277.1 lysozyme [Salmonella enterica subsp. enterica serovar Senftenberg]ECS3591247.1 lysozyme [Salmonella enterica subsp. enterica serovar Schwarzengrund]EKQ4582142.1 lysozyme [Salmonella enterica subsp. enterica serovar Give]HAT2173819.1 lysozyme [Citrobacter freundii]